MSDYFYSLETLLKHEAMEIQWHDSIGAAELVFSLILLRKEENQ